MHSKQTLENRQQKKKQMTNRNTKKNTGEFNVKKN